MLSGQYKACELDGAAQAIVITYGERKLGILKNMGQNYVFQSLSMRCVEFACVS